MLAYCGLKCDECEAFIATAKNDNDLRVKLAAQWSKDYGAEIKPEYINCTGCKSTGVKIHYCSDLCEIRRCATGKKLDTCGMCGEFPCSRLDMIFKHKPETKTNLDNCAKKKKT